MPGGSTSSLTGELGPLRCTQVGKKTHFCTKFIGACLACRRDDWWNTHHSYSRDGLVWSSGADVAVRSQDYSPPRCLPARLTNICVHKNVCAMLMQADPNVTLTNGSIAKFTNRERPQIFFNETTGAPAVLFTGVCPGQKYTYAYTLAQRIRQPGA